MSENSENEQSVDKRFENLYPGYDYSSKSSRNEKDIRRRKRMKTMY
ncbi:MAG: hypothetical protein VW081_03870 [Nitrosopumilus sp.]|jgi:hypothetical protein